jgi:LysR family glycine cleavage system transcriptional activator
MKHSSSSRPPLPPLHALPALLSAAETGSFSAAAAQMGLTHSAVSRRIQHLEAWLGTKLFERQGRGVRLTLAGIRMVQRVEQAIDLVGASSEQWRDPRGPEVVRVSVLPSFTRLWLLPRIARIQGDPPDLRLDLVVEHSFADFEGDRIDFAIRYGQGTWPGLQSRLLFTETLVPVAAPSLGARLGRDASPAELLKHPLIHDTDGGGWRAWFAKSGMAFRPRAIDRRFEEYDLTIAAAVAGLGVALLRRPLADGYLASGALVPVSSVIADNPKAHYIVGPTGAFSEAAERCRARILECVADPGDD